jgi:ribonuclease P protein component
LIWRLRGARRLEDVARRGRGATAGVIRVKFLPSVVDQPPAVAYAIGRPVGGAVVRNAVRRRLRALVAQAAADGALLPGSYLVAARPPAAERSFAELGADLRASLQRVTAVAP